MSVITYSTTWDMDKIFKGGSDSPAFAEHLSSVRHLIESFHAETEAWNPDEHDQASKLKELINSFERTSAAVRQAGAFVSCLLAQNTADRKAEVLKGKVTELSAGLQSALLVFDEKLAAIASDRWEQAVEDPFLSDLRFVLEERRRLVASKLSAGKESLITALSTDGYQGWGQMYDIIVQSIKIRVGEEKYLSVGQAANKFSSSDRAVRKSVFQEWEKAWGEKADFLAKTLNHLAGFRLKVYEQRGWDDFLQEPLDINRMEKETLEAMWAAVSENKEWFTAYLKRKAELLGLEKLSWFDVHAPVTSGESRMEYQQGAEFIIGHFAKFGPELERFAKLAFEEKWIEAEDRPGKRPGGFHTFFPESSESRIFMTYSGTPSNVSTLAHELGHGFHTYAMRDMHLLNRNYAMNVAETASTFAEMIVSDAAIKNAAAKEEKIALLEDKIQRSVSLLMNIHSRYLFETAFYEERKQGLVSVDRLNQLMADAQRTAFGDALEEYHPLFWASKLHFYITGVPFYNFPYTFGFLFSLGIYAEAINEGAGYEEKYIALLKDSASMKVEDLAMKHLGVDLTKKDFWEKAIGLCIRDIKEFMALTE